MKALIAIDSFKGSCTSGQACRFAAEGLRRVYPQASIGCLPVADGGEGTVDALVAARGGRQLVVSACDPLGRPIQAACGVLPDGVGVMEMAAASGLPLLRPEERNPLVTSTYGTGQILRALLDAGCREILIGVGGSATNDAGMGMAQALGARFFDADGSELGPGGLELGRLERLDFSGLDPRLQDCRLCVLCDVDNPLCGPHGATMTFSAKKGAAPAQQERLEAALSRFADIAARDLGKEVRAWPGGGAAGGLGAMLCLLGGEICPGIDAVLDALHFEQQLDGCTLVITGEGRLDGQSAHGKVPAGVARRAKQAAGLPVFALAGGIGDGASALYDCGVDAFLSICSRPMPLEESMANPGPLLAGAAEQLARIVYAAGMR